MTITWELADLTATELFGRRLGSVLTAGTTIALNGPLGAGKTHLTRAIAEGLNVVNPALVNSPTFVLIQEYPARLPIFHFDAYRLKSPAEFESLGTDEYFQSGGVCIVEWAEKVTTSLPVDRLEITIDIIGPTARRLTISATGPTTIRILDSLAQLESALTGR
jgi:tRNA threonylcarbamoyladenosine biosynthesis protein TsaE